LRAEIRTSATRNAAALGQPQSGEQQQRDDRAVPRCRLLGRLQQHALLLDIQRPRRAARQLFAAHDRGPEPEEAKQVIHPGERLVDGRRRQAPIDLHVTLVVSGSEVTRARRDERVTRTRVPLLEPPDERRHGREIRLARATRDSMGTAPVLCGQAGVPWASRAPKRLCFSAPTSAILDSEGQAGQAPLFALGARTLIFRQRC
jgi:hypothetical protein